MYAEIMTANGFDNPWYWLLVAIVWVRAIQWTLGIPADIMRAAAKGDAQAKQDALALSGIYIRTMTRDFNQFGTILVVMTCFVLASFATMGFWNGVAILQGIFFISFPMVILGAMEVRLSFWLQDKPVSWDVWCKIYRKQRWIKIALAIIFIIVSMLWALYLEIRPYLEQL
ncbi:MAG: hypothetical protein IME92_10540 [Proteobacteria bacterium]|nr:hypothetical protein [Pseudomonadota bacterium]